MNLIPTNSKMMDVLLVDDSDDDVELMRLAFDEARLMLRLNRVENGEQCMAYLRKQGEYAGASTPDLILLDLNMPVMDGREVLAQIVVDEALRQLPVVILTTSADDRDILQMYKLRCSSYIVKPVDFNQFVRVVRGIGNYWFTVVVLPH
jgi:two-component system, chemotaxis family, response regulator Rcp1